MEFTYQDLKKIEYRYRKNLFSEPYIHHAVEIFYLTKNSMTANINGEEYKLSAGDLITVFPDAVHSYYQASEAEGHLLIVPMEYLKPFSSILTAKMPVSPVLRIHTSEFQDTRLIPALFDLMEEDFSLSGQIPRFPTSPYTADASHPYMISFARLIVGKVLSLYEYQDENGNLKDHVKRVLDYVHEHFKEGPSRSDIGRALGLNPSYVSRIFSQNLKTSLTEYIRSIQLENAALLLRETTLPVSQIAGDCGFSSLRSFNRNFREKFRESPREYRK